VVEHDLAKVGVEGSNPFARSRLSPILPRSGDASVTSTASRFALGLVAMLSAADCAFATDQSITLATTTSVQSSGLLQSILPQFTERTNIIVKVVAQATGRALDTARRGDADVVLLSDPAAEREFIDEGYGTTLRQIAWSDFVLVGPSNDPAKIIGGKDIAAALKTIAAARAAFVTRGDRSDVNIEELRLWRLSGRTSEADAREMVPQRQWQHEPGAGRRQFVACLHAV
jgi:tungstate transport system substrate-binding protein